MTPEPRPEPGEFVRWRKPGPVILAIDSVVDYDLPRGGWRVICNGFVRLIRYEPEEGIRWACVHD